MKKLVAMIFAFLPATLIAEPSALTSIMKALDTEVFTAFNQCESPVALHQYRDFFSADVEFYHDHAGVTWDRETMITNTKKYACGKYTRQLIDTSFHAYAINNFGAITEGVHAFCQPNTELCQGKARFVMVWQKTETQWLITRVLSYAHTEH